MDFQEIDAASSRGVDDTKQLLETVMHMPSSSRYKSIPVRRSSYAFNSKF